MISNELKALIDSLRFDIQAHLNGSYNLIAKKYDNDYADLLIFNEYDNRNVKIAFNFWDSWCDASKHDWQFYKNISKNDWPILAEEIIDCLENGKDITNPTVIDNFSPENKQGFFSKLKNKLFG